MWSSSWDLLCPCVPCWDSHSRKQITNLSSVTSTESQPVRKKIHQKWEEWKVVVTEKMSQSHTQPNRERTIRYFGLCFPIILYSHKANCPREKNHPMARFLILTRDKHTPEMVHMTTVGPVPQRNQIKRNDILDSVKRSPLQCGNPLPLGQVWWVCYHTAFP